MDENILKLSIAFFLCGLFSFFVNNITNISDDKIIKGKYSEYFNYIVKEKSRNFKILSYFLLIISIMCLVVYVVRKL